MKARIVFCCLLILCSNITLAQVPEEQLHNIAKHPQWHKLLHLKPASVHLSYINTDEFFLAANNNGKSSDPLAELRATIDAFNLPLGDDANQHAQCKFPARLLFLRQYLNAQSPSDFPQINCQKYNTWRSDADISSISVIFASGYMSNPASMYGHLFVKLNRSAQQSELLNYSLNYGAIITDNENPIVYIVKGIFGGYDAAYSDKQFFRHQHNYGEVELRDLWDYKLALSATDIELIVAHIWEVLPNKFDYFFIDENCAFHIAKLLELVLNKPIISDDSLWVVPSAVAQGISQSHYKNGPLLESVNFIPSRESVLNQSYKQLSELQQQIGLQLINNNYEFSRSPNYQGLSETEKSELIETLFSYHDVMKRKQPDLKNLAVNRRKLIRERLQLPAGSKLHYSAPAKKVPPHKGMPVSKVSIGGLHNSSTSNFITSGFRMTYFDDLSTDKNQTKFSNLEMLDVELISNEQKTKVLRLDLVDIGSLYKESIDWSNDNSYAWSVRGGFEQLKNNCIDCGIYFAEGNIGKSYLFSDSLAYAMLGGKAFVGDEEDLAVMAKMGVLMEINDHLEAKFEIKHMYGLKTETSYDVVLNAEINVHFAKNWEARFYTEKAESTIFGVKFNYFWGF